MMQYMAHTSVLRVGVLVWLIPKGLKTYCGRGEGEEEGEDKSGPLRNPQR